MKRREWMLNLAALAVAGIAGRAGAAVLPEMLVYKSPTCGCCNDWVKHLRTNGFTVKTVEVTDFGPIRTRFGVPDRFAACHTAVIDGYVVEGHVPASAVKRLLAEKPSAVGIGVPGMPNGAPGMEGPKPEPFSAVVFDERGRSKVFESYRPPYRW
jgi:hypothetical protein